MRRIHNYQIRKESFEDMCKAGRYNRSLEITFRDSNGVHTHKLSAGHSDVLDVYRDGKETYVLSHNEGLGYFGLEVFEGPVIPIGRNRDEYQRGIDFFEGGIAQTGTVQVSRGIGFDDEVGGGC